MPDTSADITATAAQTRAAGSRIIGFIRGAGDVIVDKLFDVANFVTKDAANVYQADGAIRAHYAPGDNRAKLIVSNVNNGTLAAPAYSEINLMGGNADVVTISAFNSYVNTSETGLIFSLRNSSNAFGERMRLTGNGNLGVGTSTPGSKGHFSGTNATILTVESTNVGAGDTQLRFLTPDRDWRIGQNVGGVGVGTLVLYDVSGGAPRLVLDGGGIVRPGGDNSQPLGAASFRWTTAYLGSSPVVTCDVRLKFYRAEHAPGDAEHAAALECFEVFGFFQYLAAIERENSGGAPARWHFGPKAQEVWAIFASHGLAAPLGEDGLPPVGSVPPAFLCFDTWGEETAPVMAWWRPSGILGLDGEPVMLPCAEGEEGTEQRPTGETYVTREAGNIFGVRIDQLQSLMLVALNKERKDHAARIAALEAA